MKRWMLVGVFALITGSLLAAELISRSSRSTVLEGEYTANLAQGAAIYAEACASCHGVALEGQPNWQSRGPDGRLPAPPHDETGHTWHHPDGLLLRITQLGSSAVVGQGYESNMPGFGDRYSDDELRDVLEWIKSQWPERERAYQARLTEQDRAAE